MTEDVSFAEMTTGIISAFVSNNTVEITDLPVLIQLVHAALKGAGSPLSSTETADEKPTPAQIRKSIKPDGLVSFIDGKSYKTLKRHVGGHGMTLAEYKEKFGLPKEYPTTSPEYSAKRSAMAKSLGLGASPGRRKEKTPVAPTTLAPGRANPKKAQSRKGKQ